jgi:hypothetical protein
MRNSPTIEIRPRRNNGEGAIGYLMRVARAHGVPQLPEMLLQIGIPWFKLAQGKHIDEIADAVAVDPTALSFDTGCVVPGGGLLRGERLHRGHWSVHAGRRACFECLAEDPLEGRLPRRWHRAWWDVQPLSVCAVHRARLLGSCPRCGEHLDFRFTSIDCCPNGHALVQARRGAPLITDCSGDAYLSGRLGAVPRAECALLDAGSLGEAIQALDLVGAASLKGHRLREARDLDRHVVLDAGYRALSAWPVAFDSILDALLAGSDIGPGKWGAAVAYGPFHAGLCELRNGPIATALKERTRRHAVANGVAISRTVFGVAETANDLCSIKEAANRLGLGFDRARRELARRGLVPARTRRGTPVAILRTAVDNLLSEKRDTITLAMVARNLHIGRAQTRRLVSAGVFGTGGAIRRREIEELLQKLSSLAPPRLPRHGAAPLPNACRTARCRIEAALGAILENRIPIIGFRSGQGFGGVFVRISDLRDLGKACRDAMTVDDAAEALQLKWETVRGLTRLGLLRAGKAGIGRAGIEAFQEDYVAGAHLAQAAGLCPRTLVKVMAEAGIAPVAAPPRCRQVFYRRSDIVGSRNIGLSCPTLRAAGSRGGTA